MSNTKKRTKQKAQQSYQSDAGEGKENSFLSLDMGNLDSNTETLAMYVLSHLFPVWLYSYFIKVNNIFLRSFSFY